jgi:hypothetical protein
MTTVAAATWNAVTDQGGTFDRQVTYRYNGTPFDFTGWGFRFALKRTFDSTAALEMDTADGDPITLGGPSGTIQFTVSAVTMAGLTGKYLWDGEAYDPLNTATVVKVWRGTVTVRPEVTT